MQKQDLTCHCQPPQTPSLCPPQSEIGFGKLETYIKLDKLGEVRSIKSHQQKQRNANKVFIHCILLIHLLFVFFLHLCRGPMRQYLRGEVS